MGLHWVNFLQDDISSPTNVPFLYFSDADLFSAALQNSEVTSNCCYKDHNSSFGNNLTIPLDIEQLNNGHHDNTGNTNPIAPTTTSTTTTTTTTATSSANYNITATDNLSYACRKTLADSRPRVRGRFAKNDDCGGTPRQAYSNHEEDDVVVKEKEEMVDSSDIFADISGVNSLKYNYSIQSWL
ncbi:hypothetical protein GOBAR_DD02108 [Gossypium barbadense]|nr:hypothetical protein GOBAR_DD02108 [Gossypium barbadense]